MKYLFGLLVAMTTCRTIGKWYEQTADEPTGYYDDYKGESE